MSLNVDPQPVLGTASPKKSFLHKEVCGGLACSEGIRSTVRPTVMPDHSHLPGLAALACAPCRKAILVRSCCWHQQAWRVPGLTQELQWPGALSQPLIRGHFGCELVPALYRSHSLSGAVVAADSVFSPHVPDLQ